MLNETGTTINQVIAEQSSEKRLPERYSKHHRKPEVNGGTMAPRNISNVTRLDHDAWHVLYDTLEAFDILPLFRNDYEVHSVHFPKSELSQKLYEEHSNKNYKRKRRKIMWDRLFADKTLSEILHAINTIWLDPDYKFHEEIARIKKFRLVAEKVSSDSRVLETDDLACSRTEEAERFGHRYGSLHNGYTVHLDT